MKAPFSPIAALLALALAPPLSAGSAAEKAAVSKGQSWDEVVETLGPPPGLLETANYKLAVYPERRIAFREGAVAAVLPPAEEAAAKAGAEGRSELRQAAAQRRYEAIRNNVDLLRASPEERLRTWLSFSRTYPDFDVSEEIEAARKAVMEEAEEMAQARRRAQVQLEREIASRGRTFAESNLLRFHGGGGGFGFGFFGDHHLFRGRGDTRPINERGLSEVFRTPDPVSRIVGRRPSDLDQRRFGRPDFDEILSRRDFGDPRFGDDHHSFRGRGDTRPINSRGASEATRPVGTVSRIVGGQSD